MNTVHDRNGNILTEDMGIMKRILFIIVHAPEQIEQKRIKRRRIFKLEWWNHSRNTNTEEWQTSSSQHPSEGNETCQRSHNRHAYHHIQQDLGDKRVFKTLDSVANHRASSWTDLEFKPRPFPQARNTTEQIFNICILREKYIQHQWEFFQVFINFKRPFDKVWHGLPLRSSTCGRSWSMPSSRCTPTQLPEFLRNTFIEE